MFLRVTSEMFTSVTSRNFSQSYLKMIFFTLFWFFHLLVQTFSSVLISCFRLYWFFCLSVLISFFILFVLIRDFQIIYKFFLHFIWIDSWFAKIMNQYRQNEEKACIFFANHESIQTEWRYEYKQNEDLNTNRMKTWIQTKWRKIFA